MSCPALNKYLQGILKDKNKTKQIMFDKKEQEK